MLTRQWDSRKGDLTVLIFTQIWINNVEYKNDKAKYEYFICLYMPKCNPNLNSFIFSVWDQIQTFLTQLLYI